MFYLRPLYSKWRCRKHIDHAAHKSSDHPARWPHPVAVSHEVRDRKSTFLAHASTLPSPSAFPAFLEHLTASSALKRATHCMYAYRSTDNTVVTGQDDGGESGSGDRLARLLELSACENVVVVVSRWYGGVKLGSDRWKRISDVAKDALDKGGFTKKQVQNPTTGKKSGKR
ncbi:ribosomal protein S5 domain 2-type protein [Lyophyllum atratum]|nr:ribosomal protein S5 domain 2-type protein [Lyophyllum atratum]